MHDRTDIPADKSSFKGNAIAISLAQIAETLSGSTAAVVETIRAPHPPRLTLIIGGKGDHNG